MQTINCKYIQKVYSNASWLTIDTTRVFTELDGYIGSIEHNIDGFFWRECNASNNLQ